MNAEDVHFENLFLLSELCKQLTQQSDFVIAHASLKTLRKLFHCSPSLRDKFLKGGKGVQITELLKFCFSHNLEKNNVITALLTILQ